MHSQIEGSGHSTSARRGADRLRAIRRSEEGAAKRIRDASRQAGGSRRAGGLDFHAREARENGDVAATRGANHLVAMIEKSMPSVSLTETTPPTEMGLIPNALWL